MATGKIVPRWGWLILVLSSVIMFSGSRDAAAAPLSQTISHVLITNVRNGSFTISWVTDSAEDGHVDWGTTTSLGTTNSDSIASTTTHYVTISGLSPNTAYFFQVRSGTTTDDNGGAFYTVTTGDIIFPADPGRLVYGTVYETGGVTEVPNAIVYFRIIDNDASGSSGNSQWGSARTDASGIWFTELNNLRNEASTASFSFSNTTDNIQYVVQGGAAGLIGEVGQEIVEPVPSSFEAQRDFVLDGDPTAVKLLSLNAAYGDLTNSWGLILVSIIVIMVLLVLVVRSIEKKSL